MSEDRSKNVWYRGTQTPDTSKTVRNTLSFTKSLGAAVIWSAIPKDPYSWKSKARFNPGLSTVQAVQVDASPILIITESLYCSMGDVFRALDYGKENGLSFSEAKRIFNYMHNRILGKTKGGSFEYTVVTIDGDELSEDDVELSFTSPQTLISITRDDFDASDGDIDFADCISADTFVFADAPAFQEAATRLGYRGTIYHDVFQGGKYASKDIFGIPVEDLDEIFFDVDINMKSVPSHLSLRPFVGANLDVLWSRLGEEIATEIKSQ